jgi:hypothetical protein
MKILFRVVVTFVSAVATFYFVYWMGGALVLSRLSPWVAWLVAIVFAIVAARYVWMHTKATPPGLVSSTIVGALVTGGFGFVAGFFGPILLTPSSNQGPLLGLFITGPLGFMLGAVGGVVYWFAWGRS